MPRSNDNEFRAVRGGDKAAFVHASSGGSSILPTLGLGLAAALAGFAGIAFLAPQVLTTPVMAPVISLPNPVVRATTRGPRVITRMEGVKETQSAALGGLFGSGSGTQGFAMSYVAAMPVVLRMANSWVEIDTREIGPIPLGERRTPQRLLDHGAETARRIEVLTDNACDQHGRWLAAAQVNLFIAGFFAPRTPIATDAPANVAFWSQAETAAVRRAVADRAERGALAPADFGLDTSPEVKGLFQDVRVAEPTCG